MEIRVHCSPFFKSRFPHMETSPLVVKGSKLSVYALHIRPSNSPGGIFIVPAVTWGLRFAGLIRKTASILSPSATSKDYWEGTVTLSSCARALVKRMGRFLFSVCPPTESFVLNQLLLKISPKFCIMFFV